MKFSVNAKALANTLASLTRIVERRNTYPILANVHITAGDGKLVLRATDLDIEATVTIEAAIDVDGTTTIPAHMLADICKKLPGGAELSAEVEHEGEIRIVSGRSRYTLATLSPDSFPDINAGEFLTSFELDAREFGRALKTVVFATSTEESRYYLCGVYMHITTRGGAEGLTFVATDGHRLANCWLPVTLDQNFTGIIIPRKTVAEIERFAEAFTGPIRVEVSDTKIRVSAGSIRLLSKLIEGTFPDYERVTPKGNNKTVVVDIKALRATLDRVGTMATDRGGKAVKLQFHEGVVVLDVSNPDHGTATEDVPVEMDPEMEVEVGFNIGYLNDILGALPGDKVAIAMLDGTTPTLLTPSERGDISFVLMPMRV